MNLNFEKNETEIYDYTTHLDNILVGKADDNWGGPGSEFSIYFTEKIFEFSNKYIVLDFFNENVGAFTVPFDVERYKNLSWIKSEMSSLWLQNADNESEESKDQISFYIMPDFVKWSRPYSIINFIEKLISILKPYEFCVDFKNDEDFLSDGFSISCNLNIDKTINEEVENFLSIIDQELKIISENFSLIDVSSIVHKYSFPPEIRQACEQYLVYFSKFLEDYGIEITSVLESKNEDTFFSVKPKNSEEALSNIRNLLNFYLSLPDLQNLEIFAKDYNDISVQQLLSNIYHLKSQLFLAQSIIESKNATIESLKFSNFQKQIYIEENFKNEEKTFDGLVTIQEFEYGSFKFNFPEIFRRLKRKFIK